MPGSAKKFPDMCFGTSPIQELPNGYIWSAGNMERFFDIQLHVDFPTFNVGYVGTVDYKKLHPEFAHMCEDIDLANLMFVICGEYSFFLHPPHKYWFTGKIAPENIDVYFSMMHVFGYPLRSDHYGTCEQVIGEAMACGLPVVAMNNPAEKEIIVEGVTGFLCNTPDEYVENIEHLYHKPELRKWIGTNAREFAFQRYNPTEMANQWGRNFELIMQEPKRMREAIIWEK
jgi:glycosyltransferase involved in cell wall biosynthesis